MKWHRGWKIITKIEMKLCSGYKQVKFGSRAPKSVSQVKALINQINISVLNNMRTSFPVNGGGMFLH
jgi:hypothetical protein